MKVEDPFASCGIFLHASIKVLLAAGSGIHVQAGAVLNFLAIDVGAEFLVRLKFRLAPNFATHSTHSASPPARWQFYCLRKDGKPHVCPQFLPRSGRVPHLPAIDLLLSWHTAY